MKQKNYYFLAAAAVAVYVIVRMNARKHSNKEENT